MDRSLKRYLSRRFDRSGTGNDDPQKHCLVGLINGLCEWSLLMKRKEPLRLFVLEFVSLIQERQLKEEASIDNSTQGDVAPASLEGAPFILFTITPTLDD